MKKRISGICLIIALLMVVPTFTVMATGTPSELEVVKEVWDPEAEEWVDFVEAEFGEEVQFRINITYHQEISGTHYAWHINVTDTLPSILDYVDGSAQFSVEPVETGESEDGKTIWWYFGDYMLANETTLTIKFNASVVDYGEEDNVVGVYAEEYCNQNEELVGRDCATVCVPEPEEPEPLEFEKLVWDPETQEWVENLSEVRKDTPVKFQITATYLGINRMKCFVVHDLIPEDCLEYANTVYVEIAGDEIEEGDERYPDIFIGGETIEICEEEYPIPDNAVVWDWRNRSFDLENGESVIIEFEANVTYYCDDKVTNHACALIWACQFCCEHYWAHDTANVTCTPPDPICDKKVWDGNGWVDVASVFVGDLVKYKIEITYFGNHYLSDIRIVDKLPCILRYADNANITESNVSADMKTIWWNLTGPLNDGETLTIEYYVEVTGVTDCEECGKNIATFTAYECNTQIIYEGEAEAKVTSAVRPPRPPPVEIDICIKKSGWGRVSAIIKNVGEEDVSDVEWTIDVKGGVLKRLNVDVGSTIDLIEAGKSAGICTGCRSILRKFGRITITVTATVGEDIFEKTACGFVFGRIILVRPLIRL